jgi:hypothetical protein
MPGWIIFVFSVLHPVTSGKVMQKHENNMEWISNNLKFSVHLHYARNQIRYIDIAVSVAGSFSQSMTELCPKFCTIFYVLQEEVYA